MVIDLKNVDVYFVDGSTQTGAINNSKTGAINLMAGYSAGATSIVVDGFTGVIPVGSALTIDSVTGFKVTSTVETSGNTTTINFTPALSASVADDDVVSVNGFTEGATTIKVDGFTGTIPTGALIMVGAYFYEVTAHSETSSDTTSLTFASPGLLSAVSDNDEVVAYVNALRVKVGEGNLTYSEKKPREYKLDRGRLDTIRNGDEQPMEVNFTMSWEFLTASTGDPPTPEDVLKQRGEASEWVSADTEDPCAPYCVDIILYHNPPGCTSIDRELIVLPNFYYESLDHDTKAGTVAAQGKCNALEAEVSRVAVS